MGVVPLFFLISLFGSLFIIVQCDIFASMVHLREAFNGAKARNSELKLLLKGYIDEQLHRMERTERFINELHDLSGEEIKDPTFKITHSFNAYRFIRNHSDIFNATLDKAVTEITSFENDAVSLYRSSVSTLLEGQANIDDLNGTVEAFHRLQTTYSISTRDFADGSYIDEPKPKLTADECKDVSAILCLNKRHARGLEWLKEAKQRIHMANRDVVIYERLLRVAAKCALKGGNHFAAKLAIAHTNGIKYIDRKSRILARRIDTGVKELQKTATPKEVEHMKKSATVMGTKGWKYNRLCSGKAQNNITPLNGTLLSCRYDNNNGHPYLLIQPVKYEQLSLDPYIVVYHDVLSEKDVRRMQYAVKGNMKRSLTGDGRISRESSARISASAQITKRKLTRPLNDKVKAITSLKPGGEFLQIGNYGVGGYYTPHHDAFSRIYENNRIATFMVYLSDVEMGGATVFPKIGLSVFPKKGTAVFWSNMYRNVTTRDLRLRHSACPVLKGDKWVGTFWIRAAGQEFSWPCTLNKLE